MPNESLNMVDPTFPDPLYHWDEEMREPLDRLGLVDLLFMLGLGLALFAAAPVERLFARIRSNRK